MYSKEKKVTCIAPTKSLADAEHVSTLTKVAAYCRVSTDEEDQINSYEIQQRKYTEKILSEPGWKMVGIYADRGITGTSISNREEFKRMIRHCKKGKIDMILTKSVSRFARNTLDVLTYTRKLRELGIDVYFEEQNIHSIDPASDFMISLYGYLAQSESESISENVKWGKRQSVKEGKVPFPCSRFMGYTKDVNGNIIIVPEEAEIVRTIYKMFLDGKTPGNICDYLNSNNVPLKGGGKQWYPGTIQSMLENVKYKGDVLTNKTYRTSVTSKKIRKNNGEVEQFYISNHHPAIIDDTTFLRVQKEIERRSSMEKAYDRNRKTEKGKYSSKFVFNDILVCGECGMPYRRCVWTSNGNRRIVWRCVKRLEHGRKYCHNSPTIYEDALKNAVMQSIKTCSDGDVDLKERLKTQIKTGFEDADRPRKIKALQDRLDSLTHHFDMMLNSITVDTMFDEDEFAKLSKEKYEVEEELSKIRSNELSDLQKAKIEELYSLIDLFGDYPPEFDDDVVRKCIDKIVVIDKNTIEITYVDGFTVSQPVD